MIFFVKFIRASSSFINETSFGTSLANENGDFEGLETTTFILTTVLLLSSSVTVNLSGKVCPVLSLGACSINFLSTEFNSATGDDTGVISHFKISSGLSASWTYLSSVMFRFQPACNDKSSGNVTLGASVTLTLSSCLAIFPNWL